MAWLMLAQAIAAASGPVAIESVEQARAMTPQALADALLAPGHPPVDVADVAPLTMEAPPPPGAPPQFRVFFQTRPMRAEAAGYCTRSSIAVTIVNPGAAAGVTVDKVTPLHRLTAICGAGKQPYGRFQDARALAVVRDLDRLRRARRPRIKVEYSDALPAESGLSRYRDGIAALKAVDLDMIFWAGDARRGASLASERILRAPPTGVDQTGFYSLGNWSAIVTREKGRITHVWLKRAYPAPF